MMHDTQVAVLAMLAAAVVLFFSFYILAVSSAAYRATKRDGFRFRLFAARDKLYIAAINGLLPVDSEAFVRLRDTINFFIRESNRAGAIEFFICVGTHETDRGSALIQQIEQLPPEARGAYLEIVEMMATSLRGIFETNSRVARLFNWLNRIANSEKKSERTSDTIRLKQSVYEVDRMYVSLKANAGVA